MRYLSIIIVAIVEEEAAAEEEEVEEEEEAEEEEVVEEVVVVVAEVVEVEAVAVEEVAHMFTVITGGSRGGSGSGSKGSSGSRPGTGIPDDPDDPGDSDSGRTYYYTPHQGYLPSQEQVQEAMGNLEFSMNYTNTTDGSPPFDKIVEVILFMPTCTPTTSDGFTYLPTSLTQPCTSKTLSSTQQLSCACYTPATWSTPCAVPSGQLRGVQGITVPTVAFDRFDAAANFCHDYFDQQGYAKLAAALAGKNKKNDTILGAGFCSNVAKGISMTATPTASHYDEHGCGA
ncbi:hypothetical protein N0V90_004418 [Kalmusia sp. IMI 367209]|nr:hypothetical protein N0V90_004418 [Kalmusia sp. IMI 367209]